MSDGMFGSPTGFRIYDRDQADLALLAGQAEHQHALAGLNKAQAETMLRKQKTEEDLLAVVARGYAPGAPGGPAGSKPDEIIQRLYDMAGLRAAIGQTEEAGKLLKDATQSARNLEAGKASNASAAGAELTAHLKRLNFVRDRLAAVTGPATYGQAMLQLQADPEIAKALPDWLKTYNPEAIKGFVEGSTAQIKKIELGLKQAAEERQTEEAAARERDRQARRTLAERRTAAYEASVGAREKADGGLSKPSAADVKAMSGQLKSLGYAVGDKDELGAQASELEDRAQQIKAQRPSMGITEARAYVINEAVKSGELTPKRFGGLVDPTFKSRLGSITKPITLTRDFNPATAKVGDHYRAPDGSLNKYLGSGNFQTVVAPRKVKAGTQLPPLPSETGDDEEDN